MSQEKPELIYCQKDEEENILKDKDGNPIRYDQVIFRSEEQLTKTINTLEREEQKAWDNIAKMREAIEQYQTKMEDAETRDMKIFHLDQKEKGKEDLYHFVLELSLVTNQITHLSTGQNTVIDTTPLWQIKTKPEVIEPNS